MSHLRLIAVITLAPTLFLLVLWLFIGAPLHTAKRPAPAAPATTATPLRPLSHEQVDLVLDLFDPSQGLVEEQKNAAELAGRIERALTVNFVLRKCEIISQREYGRNHAAIVTYAERMKLAPTSAGIADRMRSITEAANASYSLIYSRTDCRNRQLDSLAAQLADWRDKLLDD